MDAALIINGAVDTVCRNAVAAQMPEHPTGQWVEAPAGEVFGGFSYANGVFTAPPPPPVSRADVDAERDRRTATQFQFEGKFFQLDEKSIGRITAMGADARFAIAAGAQEGDYLWADPTAPFGFIATDNSVMLMDAQTMAAFANAAKLWVSRHTFAGLVLKSQPVIPSDFATNDAYWPVAE